MGQSTSVAVTAVSAAVTALDVTAGESSSLDESGLCCYRVVCGNRV
jgi:hypothetical protein